MLKQKDVRSALTLAATLAICVLSASGGAQAQGVDMDWKGHQLVPPSQVNPKQPQLNQELGNRSKFGSLRDAGGMNNQPGIPQLPHTRIGELRDVSNVKRGALALLLGFNILAIFAWLFVAGKAEVKLDRFFHGDPLATGKVDRATVAANPVTRH